MNEVQTLADTQKQTQISIEYSTKISKQVIIAKLNEQITTLNNESLELHNETKLLRKVYAEAFTKELQDNLQLAVDASRDITQLRRSINKFMPSDQKPYPNNEEFISSTGVSTTTQVLINPPNDSRHFYSSLSLNATRAQVIQQALDTKQVDIPVIFDAYFGGLDDESERCCCEFAITLSEDLLAKLQNIQTVYERNESNRNQITALEKKLSSIDQVIEKMEAELLVNELRKTDEGKHALSVMNGLVEGYLGDLPKLLADPK
jgi:hypothetical protein